MKKFVLYVLALIFLLGLMYFGASWFARRSLSQEYFGLTVNSSGFLASETIPVGGGTIYVIITIDKDTGKILHESPNRKVEFIQTDEDGLDPRKRSVLIRDGFECDWGSEMKSGMMALAIQLDGFPDVPTKGRIHIIGLRAGEDGVVKVELLKTTP